MRNKPNLGRGGCREPPLFQDSAIATFQSTADCAEQSQFARLRRAGRGPKDVGEGRLCKTNPIRPSRQVGRTAGERKCAKRSQSSDCGLRISDCGLCETKPIPPCKVSGEDAQPTKSRGPTMRNKANFRMDREGWGAAGLPVRWPGQFCETKPIARSGAPGRCPPCGGPDGPGIRHRVAASPFFCPWRGKRLASSPTCRIN
jgi:hypothetical protein